MVSKFDYPIGVLYGQQYITKYHYIIYATAAHCKEPWRILEHLHDTEGMDSTWRKWFDLRKQVFVIVIDSLFASAGEK
jgi:hypothetical protein